MKFGGGYAEPGYLSPGETHTFNSAGGAYNGIVPANQFSLAGGGWAWEIAGRVSVIDLNDQLATANGVAGSTQTV